MASAIFWLLKTLLRNDTSLMIRSIFLSSIISFLFFGCAPFMSQKSTIDEEPNERKLPLAFELPMPEESYILTNAREVALIADSIAKNGVTSAINGEFSQAQQLMLLALDLLVNGTNEPVMDSVIDNHKTFDRIGKFYVNLMPPTYLDSVPSAISPFVARYQLYEISNTIDTNNLDTSVIPKICENGANYNIPPEYNKRVQKALITLLAAKRSKRMETLLNRAEYYRPFMITEFEKAGLPTDLTFLPLLESAFNPHAYSWAHASGLWQFIPATGRAFDLRNNYWVDERRDPVKATRGAIGYFTRLYKMFDDWYLALASYNCGEGRVRRTLKRDEADNYWDIKLPKETMNYVPLYIAYQIIAKNPHCFGFEVDTTIAPYGFDTVKVSDCIDMSKIAKGIGMDPEEFIKINPHIKRWCTPPETKNITLYVPLGDSAKYEEFYKTLTPADKVKWHRYKIKNGDNLGAIANKFGVSVTAIKSVNRMKNSRIIAGRYILIPLASETTKISNDKDIAAAPAKKAAPKKQAIPTGDKINYKVHKGESLYSISLKFGVTVDEIISWNSIKNPSKISIGTPLILYGEGASTTTESTKIDAKSSDKEFVVESDTPSGKKEKYSVKKGDNFYAISKKLDIPLSDLIKWNKKDSNNPVIYPGEKLVYYTKTSVVTTSTTKYVVRPGDTFYSIASMFNIKTSQLQKANRTSSSSLHPGDILIVPLEGKPVGGADREMIIYTVKSGDNLWSISNAFNVPIRDICLASNISKRASLHPGDTLKIPQKR
jgi:membrane-bound lytic murein transglycosylase D